MATHCTYVAFADPPHVVASSIPKNDPLILPKISEDLVPLNGAPSTLMEWAVLILNTPDPVLKVRTFQFLLSHKCKGLVGRADEARSAIISYRKANFSWTQIEEGTTTASDAPSR